VRRQRCAGRGFISGLVGGPVASWTMNQFWAVKARLQQQMQSSGDQESQNQQEEREENNPTVKTAETITRPQLKRELTKQEKKTGGSVVHYAFGALTGGVYGMLSEVMPAVSAGFGMAWGSAVWLGADEIMVPSLKLGGRPQAYPLSQHLSGLGAHLVYGLTAEAVRRTMRAAC